MRTAIGRIAGPLRPPTPFEIFGRRVSTSMTIARNVLTSDTASAPASSAARANDATSVTFGVSFGMIGSARDLADGADDVVRADQAAAELDAAFLDVRARDVQLDGRDAFGVRQDPRHLGVLVERRAADVDDDRRAARAQLGQLFVDEAAHADALQADGVQHAGRRFDDARRRMAFALVEEQALDGDAAERRQVDEVGVLDAVAEAAARGDQRVLEGQRADANGEIHGTSSSVPDDLIGVEHRAGEARSHVMESRRARRASARRSCSSRPCRSP